MLYFNLHILGFHLKITEIYGCYRAMVFNSFFKISYFASPIHRLWIGLISLNYLINILNQLLNRRGKRKFKLRSLQDDVIISRLLIEKKGLFSDILAFSFL